MVLIIQQITKLREQEEEHKGEIKRYPLQYCIAIKINAVFSQGRLGSLYLDPVLN